MEERNKITELYLEKVKLLKKHNNSYYIKDKPIISDTDYDILKQEILALEKKFTFLKKFGSIEQIIGAPPSNKFLKIKHLQPMLSLSILLMLMIWKHFKKLITF